MFGLLKQKLTGFLDKLTGREEKKAEAAQENPPEQQVPQKILAEKPPVQPEEVNAPEPAEEKPIFDKVLEKPPLAKVEEIKGLEKTKEILIKPKTEEKIKVQEVPIQKKVDAEVPVEIKPWADAEKPKIADVEARPVEAKMQVVEKPKAFAVEEKPETAQIEPQMADAKTKPPEPKQQQIEEKPKVSAAEDKPKAAGQKASVEEKTAWQKSPVEEKKTGFSISNIWPFGKKEQKPAEAAFDTMPQVKKGQVAAPTSAPLQKIEAKRQETVPAGFGQRMDAKAAESLQAKSVPAVDAKSAEQEIDFDRLKKKSESGDKKMEVRMGIAKSAATFFSPEVQIAESDIRDLADELELAMLEADVAYEVSLEISSRLKKELVGLRVPKNRMHESVRGAVANVIAGVLRSGKEFDMVEKAKSLPKPAKILFIGPNGAGKTTTMAKLAKKLSDNGMTCVFAAADTFRAAAIEQLEVHAGRLNVPIIKSKYGADPAAVAFDAVQYAKAHSIDVVMIDSSGRQDTNANLLDELKKIVRIIKPDLKIYIGESIGGNATVDQIKGFADSVGLDGVVLTKLDCDAKGGTALSVAHVTGVPILYFGIGQKYEDLQEFSADELAKSLVNPPVAS